MSALLPFALKVLLLSGLLFGYYILALRNRHFHHWNRFYLLSAVLLSLTLPFVNINFSTDANNKSELYALLLSLQGSHQYLDEIVIGGEVTSKTVSWPVIFYGGVCLGFLISFMLSLVTIWKMIRRHAVEVLGSVNFIRTEEPSTPFTFWNYVFWNQKIQLETAEGKQILQHELVHVHERHTFDKLLLQTVLVLFWWNPFFWMIRKELHYVHEFIADKRAIGTGGAEAFAAMVLNAAYPTAYHQLTHPFFQTSLKRRLRMLTQNKNPRYVYIGRIAVLPLVAIAVIAFAQKEQNEDHQRLVAELTGLQSDLASGQRMLVDSPPGRKEIKFVDVNKDKDRIEIQYTDGSKQTLTRTEARELGFFNENAILDSKNGSQQVTMKNVIVRDLSGAKEKPLYVVDGKVVADIGTLSPNNVESVNVLKGESALKKYGKAGSDGVVEIISKKNASQPIYIVDGTVVKDISAIVPNSIESVNVLKGEQAIEKHGQKGAGGVIEIKTKKPGTSAPTEFRTNDSTVIKANVSRIKLGVDRIEIDSDSVEVVAGRPLKGTQPTNEPIVVMGRPTNGKGKPSNKDMTEMVVGGRPSRSSDLVFERTENEPTVDIAAWRRFLETNAISIVSSAAAAGAPGGKYTINVRFIVNTDGTLSDFSLLNDPGYGMGAKLLETLRTVPGPKWNPATQNGHAVRSYHVQPVTFAIATN